MQGHGYGHGYGYGYGAGYGGPQPGIVLELEFGFLGALGGTPPSSSSFFRGHNTFVALDGVTQEIAGGAVHFLPCAPGGHWLQVYFMRRPTFLAAGPVGAQTAQVWVPPGGVARVRYEASLGWSFGNATLAQVG